MNLKNIGIIIRREYLNRVKKKSFLITTFVVPILMAALCLVPMLLMMTSKEKVKTIGVVDRSEIVLPYLEDTDTIDYTDCSAADPEALKATMAESGLDAVLVISALTEDNLVTADLTSKKPLGMEMVSSINRRVNDAVEDYRIQSYNIEGLSEILATVRPDIKLMSYTMDDEGKETVSETGVYAILSMVLGLVLFLFITLFGGMVMSAVIEEKASRVVEVLVSSVKATELMFGKIIGIALVALTQFILWIVLTGAIVAVGSSFMGKDLLASMGDNPTEMVQGMGVDPSAVTAVAGAEPDELGVVLTTLGSLPIGKFILIFIVYFIFGYMLYASLFAAIGSAVENEGDTQQLQLPVTIPLMIGYFIAIYAFNAPDSSIAFWGSMIPFTSPIVMLARTPFGVPGWEYAVSIALLVATFALCAWLSAKIYKVGILMFGKKSTWKDLWKWLKQK
ncbi:MAG: ABC transporter permease [Bacteroidales bacterium]|nr:ABC transporter permease [Bacteroidales bacterium]